MCIAFGPKLTPLLLENDSINWTNNINYPGVQFLPCKHIRSDVKLYSRNITQPVWYDE